MTTLHDAPPAEPVLSTAPTFQRCLPSCRTDVRALSVPVASCFPLRRRYRRDAFSFGQGLVHVCLREKTDAFSTRNTLGLTSPLREASTRRGFAATRALLDAASLQRLPAFASSPSTPARPKPRQRFLGSDASCQPTATQSNTSTPRGDSLQRTDRPPDPPRQSASYPVDQHYEAAKPSDPKALRPDRWASRRGSIRTAANRPARRLPDAPVVTTQLP